MTEPFRFLHVADLFVSGQLRQTGQSSSALTTPIATATEKAWENVVTAAVDAEVDFVLLSGACFDASDFNPRAEFLLREGFDLLESHGIRTFALPSDEDPQSAWRAFDNPTENVTLFYNPTAEPVAFLRQGKVVATFAPAHVSFDSSQKMLNINQQQAPFCIGYCTTRHPVPLIEHNEANEKQSNALNDIIPFAHSQNTKLYATTTANEPVNYLAWSGSSLRQDFRLEQDTKLAGGMAHHPGPAQGLCSQQSGPSGCTVIDVDSTGRISHRFVSTAVVRWESRNLELNAESTRGNLIQQMSSQLLNDTNSTTEPIWLVEWNVAGVGPLYQTLLDPNTQDEISMALQKQVEESQFEFVNRIRVIPQVVPQEIGHGDNESLFTEFLESLASEELDVKKQLSALMTGAAEVQSNAKPRFDNSNIAAFDNQRVEFHARQFGEAWFRKAI